jgi:hypothetical protein
METDQNAALAARCQELAEVVDRAGTWVRDNRELVRGEHDGLLAELRRGGRFFRRCRIAANRKMCVGVFGPSQAGKSYLISALARDAAGSLWADFGGEPHDFVREINPEGGKEATGLVTRFTMTPPGARPPGFPVQIRLLSETDLVKIFANTYYADFEHQEEPDVKAITACLDALEKKSGPASGVIGLDDLEELQEYLAKNFKARPRVQELGRSFWPRALEIGPRLALADRARLYGLIWDAVAPFDQAFLVLAEALERLGHPDTAYCPLTALIPREASIIDVAMLEGLGEAGQTATLEVATLEGVRVALPLAVVTALTAELTIAMRERPDDYYEHTDLLDFPGYRSRYKFTNIRAELAKEGMLKELFLRGKVAYLFQRYCAERELTGMLLCIGPSNQEVQDLPAVINDWILSTHGETPEHRKGKPVSLYFILTKSDIEFEEKLGQGQVKLRWDIRLHASLLDFFGKQHDWPENWDGERKFDNLFLLRNPNMRFDQILNYDSGKKESGVRAEKNGFVTELHDAFLGSATVREHFANPPQAWDALMQLNDGGIGLIREKLRPACNPALKRQQIETSLAERLERLVSRLKPYWKTDDKEEERQGKIQFGQQLARRFFEMIKRETFGMFLRGLGVSDHDLHDLYYEARRRMLREESEGSAPRQAPVAVSASPMDATGFLEEYFGKEAVQAPEPEPVEAAAPEVPRDEAAAFAALIESHWFDQLHAIAEDPVRQRYFGLPEKEFADFVTELIQGAGRLGLRGEMEEAMRKAAAYADIDMERVIWKQSSLAAGRINAFVDWLGYNPRLLSEEARSVLVGVKRVTVFNPPPPVRGMPRLSEELGVLEQQWYRDWLSALFACITANVDYDGTTTIDLEQNKIVGDIIKVLTGAPS